jgi:hypothetical protein
MQTRKQKDKRHKSKDKRQKAQVKRQKTKDHKKKENKVAIPGMSSSESSVCFSRPFDFLSVCRVVIVGDGVGLELGLGLG